MYRLMDVWNTISLLFIIPKDPVDLNEISDGRLGLHQSRVHSPETDLSHFYIQIENK